MIESLFVGFCVVILGSWIVLIIIAMTVADLQKAIREKVQQRHPHARKWRGRPSVSVLYDHAPAGLSKQSLVRGSYRHISFSDIHYPLRLHIGSQDILARTALADANTQLQQWPSARFIEIIPLLATPQTTTEFFHAYSHIALSPFIKIRAVLNIRSSRRLWPTLLPSPAQLLWRDRCYAIFAWVLGTTNMLLFVYLTNITISAGEPLYLIGYIAVFYAWLIWSAVDYPHLSVRHKIVYAILAPASFGYFLYRALATPFTPLKHLPLRILQRRVLS